MISPSCHPRQTLRGQKGDLTPTLASYTHCLENQFCGNRCGRPDLGPASLLSAMGCPWSKAQTPPTIMSEAGRASLLRSTLEGCLPDDSGMLSLPGGTGHTSRLSLPRRGRSLPSTLGSQVEVAWRFLLHYKLSGRPSPLPWGNTILSKSPCRGQSRFTQRPRSEALS